MINLTPATPLVIGAVFTVGVLFGGCDLASASPKTRPIAPASTRSVSTSSALAEAGAPVAAPSFAKPRGRAYLFRGALGPIFSRGMDRLTDRIEKAGIQANVYEFTICQLIAKKAVREYREDPAPIILIGHSMGGLCSIKFAETLQDENIPVSLIVAVDPAHATDDVPLNVERFINVFLSTSVLGGGDVKPLPGYQGHYASFDLSEQSEVTHINIDKMDSLHAQLVDKILQLSATPAKGEGEAVPLRYVVPPNTPIDLWDSGTPVFARPGDTMQTVADANHIPLWALAQANKTPDSMPLIPGQRIIVPRHLTPLTAVSGQTPPKR